MNFGKLQDIGGIDFAMPQDHLQTAKVLEGGSVENLEVYFGFPVWGCKDWVGKIYPNKAKPADYLKHYSQQVNTIEFNTTHYRTPDEATVGRWLAESTEDFHFCPKILQGISHADNLTKTYPAMGQFTASIQKLGGKLGPCFMQFPPDFSPRRADELIQFLRQFPLPLALEFRHPDWFSGHPEAEKVFQLMKEKQVGTVLTDVAGRRDVLHMRLTTNWAFVRFVGNDLHSTDYSRIDDWITRIGKWQEQGLRTLYFFVHQPEDTNCPELLQYFLEGMNKQLKLDLPLLKFYPKHIQTSLF